MKRKISLLMSLVLSIPLAQSTLAELPKAATLDQQKIIAPEMVAIKSGCFQMGSPDNEKKRGDDEVQHQICVKQFKLMTHEVTVGQFHAFISATGYRTDAEKNTGGKDGCFVDKTGSGDFGYVSGFSWKKPNYSQDGTHPVVCVSYNDADAYSKWLSNETGKQFRLPTEAESEYAVRAGTDSTFYWGSDPNYTGLCRFANSADKSAKKTYPDLTASGCDDGYVYTSPKKSFHANSWGLYDLSGNVWEWNCSLYSKSYDGSENQCSNGEEKRSLRGGSFFNGAAGLRSADRHWHDSGDRFFAVGFRLAQSD